MKKLFVILLCLLAVLTVVACKNDPSGNNGKESGPVEPKWDAGILLVKPAEDCTWSASQPLKFQFKLFQEFYAGESIEIVLKLSDNITSITPRKAGDGDTKWIGELSLYSPSQYLTKDDDGWYVITIPENLVTLGLVGSDPVPGDSWDQIGISTNISSEETRPNTYIAIKEIRLNGEKVAFSPDPDYVLTWDSKPNGLSVTITQ